MEPIKLSPTKTLPEVTLDAAQGRIHFGGRSRPENSSGFFLPILDWVKRYAQSPAPTTECTFKIEYFNSATAKCFVDILRILDTIHGKTTTVTVTWHYDQEDDNMKEAGEEYRELFNMNFKLMPY